jgi:hypothetical protein
VMARALAGSRSMDSLFAGVMAYMMVSRLSGALVMMHEHDPQASPWHPGSIHSPSITVPWDLLQPRAELGR